MPRATPEAILLVDGYNMVGAWHELKRVRDKRGLEEARHQLVETLMGYSSYQGFDTQIVFDAQYRDLPNHREVITDHVSVCYTDFGQTADSFIERTCAIFRQDVRKFKQRLIVATSDQAQKLTVIGFGAEWMSAERLANDVEFVARRVHRQIKPSKKPTGRFLMHSIDPAAQQRLAKLRFGDRNP
ncbi:NYN domain-containing protein [Myxacorys almedinensis]|uniref:NYN domain-containing protein n=1 Tax=Myxacorys almedinensis A TaxID=2690445 RepID=A0A8J8CM33_9CYAN|nr:NYN domain-containing protein [Myxacorys almedinensis]NDJ16817.1 NYN domain-containing protein [Myxacorys almedinensis A]